jgi:hypothetical protein
MIERAERERKLQTTPCWTWSGADALNFSEPTEGLERLVAMLPAKQSSDKQILAFLIYLRGRFARWLHQDEFGSTRRQQTAALRALKKSIQTLQRQLAKGGCSQREQLDAILRNGNGRSAPILEWIYEPSSDLERGLRISSAPKRKIDWALKIQTCAMTTIAQSQSLDTNADGKILLTAARYRFDDLRGLSILANLTSLFWRLKSAVR